MKTTIKQYLRDNHITQTEFAKELGISDAYVSKMVHNRIQLTEDIVNRLEDYEKKHNIEFIVNAEMMEDLTYKRKYEELDKAYTRLQCEYLKLAEENSMYRAGIGRFLEFAEYCKSLPMKAKKKGRPQNEKW